MNKKNFGNRVEKGGKDGKGKGGGGRHFGGNDKSPPPRSLSTDGLERSGPTPPSSSLLSVSSLLPLNLDNTFDLEALVPMIALLEGPL